MEKKRRKKNKETELHNNVIIIASFKEICDLKTEEYKCGLTSKLYKLKQDVGHGFVVFYNFEGLSIGQFDLQLERDISISGNVEESFIELSFLMEGEQIIKIESFENDIVLENEECYLVYVPKLKGIIEYHKNKPVKELKIRMSSNFIKRHKLEEEFDIIDKYRLFNFQNSNLQRPLCVKTQSIVSEIIENKQTGILKRLFLESKILELVTIQLFSETGKNKKLRVNTPPNKTVKKLYEIQNLICSDLAKQYSIQELSKHIGVNDFVLKKEFKRIFGKTIFEYATELRMKKAKELLLYTQKPIYEISELIGYKNATHFSAAFKKLEGITPKKYRDIKNKRQN